MENSWADTISADILNKKASSNVIATGITPSGPIHIGNLRELVTGNAVFGKVKQKDKTARFIFIADDFDPLRRVYPFLDNSFEKYVGMPLNLVPCPCAPPAGGHKNYAQHFLQPFLESLKKLEIAPEIILSSTLYQSGKMTQAIDSALQNQDKTAQILAKITHRDLPADWSPLNVLCSKCQKLNQTKITEVILEKHSVQYQCTCGQSGTADYSKGEAKLSWRVDWPARWQVLSVTAEPFGKDHAAAGGSWDSGKEISKQVFNFPPPYPIIYEWVHLKGEGAMSSSKGISITASEVLSIVPANVLQYFFLKSRPERHLDFDPRDGLIPLVEEYQSQKHTLAVPYLHLVSVVQAAQGDLAEIKRLLEHTGFKIKDEKALQAEIEQVKNWLKLFAPEKYKFTLQKTLPKIQLTDSQKQLLSQIADFMEKENPDAEKLHNFIYETGKKEGLNPAQTFQPIYQILINKDFGPKAGWFLVMLDKKLVVERLAQGGE